MLLRLFLYTFILSLSTEFYYRYAKKRKILDNPNARSSHKSPTVRGGGMVFFIAVIIYFLIRWKVEYPYFLAGFILLSVIGFIDDKLTLSAKLRFPFQLIATGLILYQAGLFTQDIPAYIQIIGFIIAVGFINAFNFMDGINGITGFYSLAVILSLMLLNNKHHIFEQEWFWVIIISIFIFGYYNFRKEAKMFAGDIGSMALSSLLLFWLSKLMIDLHNPLLLVLVAIYGVDSAWTILLRLKNKENIFKAHRWHLYQKFTDIWNWPHLKTALVYAIFQLILSLCIIFFLPYPITIQIIILLFTYIMLSILYFWLQYFIRKHPKP